MDLEATAERLQRRVHRKVLAEPKRAPQIVGTSVRHLRAAAIAAGSRSMDPSDYARRRLPAFLRPRPVQRFTEAEHDARAFERRLRGYRERGVELSQDSRGRWRRMTRRGDWVLIDDETTLVQRRVYRGEIRALESTRSFARRLGVQAPSVNRKRLRWKELDPRLYDFYVKRYAMEASRVAHDALVDAFRDAALDRAEQLRVGWVRECETTACGACLALADGTVHSYTERRFYRHTRCRCKPVPARGRRLPRTGQQIFDSKTRAEQDDLFHGRGGAAKADLVRSGAIELQDLVQIAADRTDWTDYVVTETPLEGLVAAND